MDDIQFLYSMVEIQSANLPFRYLSSPTAINVRKRRCTLGIGAVEWRKRKGKKEKRTSFENRFSIDTSRERDFYLEFQSTQGDSLTTHCLRME